MEKRGVFMYCSKCGNKLGDGVKFCRNCGTPVGIIPGQAGFVPDHEAPLVEPPPVHRPIGRILAPVAAAIGAMLIGIIATYAILSMSGNSIDLEKKDDIISGSPDEAARAFADAIASDDFGSAIALFGCERKAKSLDFTNYVAIQRAWVPSAVSYPSSTNIFTNANQQRLRNDASKQISGLVFSLNADEMYLDGMLKQDNGEGTLAAEITEYCSPENLDTFKILRMDYAMPDTQNTAVSIKDVERQTSMYGGVAIADCTILYEYNGKTYFGGMRFIQYDDGWYIDNACTVFGGQTAYGYLTEMSESEYIKRIKTPDWDTEQK